MESAMPIFAGFLLFNRKKKTSGARPEVMHPREAAQAYFSSLYATTLRTNGSYLRSSRRAVSFLRFFSVR